MRKFPNAVWFACTATPDYYDDKRLADLIPDKVDEVSVKEGVENGHNASFSVVLAMIDVDLTGIKTHSGGGYDQKELERRINIQARNLGVVQIFRSLPEITKTINGKEKPLVGLAFCTSVAHAKDLAVEFEQAGFRAAAVWGEQTRGEREAILARLAKGEIDIVTNDQYLGIGADFPGINVVINAAPSRSLVEVKQRVGRGMRVDPQDPEWVKIYVDVLDEHDLGKNPILIAQALGEVELRNKAPVGEVFSFERAETEAEPVAEIQIEGIRVIIHPEEVMRIVGQKSIDYQPRVSWVTRNQLQTQLGVKYRFLNWLIGGYKDAFPEYFHPFIARGGLTEYIAPEIVSAIAGLRAQTVTPKEVAQVFRVGVDTIATWAAPIIAAHPELGGCVHPLTGAIYTFNTYHPDLLDRLLKEHPLIDTAPGWFYSINETAQLLGCGRFRVSKAISIYTGSGSDWVRQFRHPKARGPVATYLHPDLVEKLRQDFKK